MTFRVEISNKVNENDWNKELCKSKFATAPQTASFHKPSEITYDAKLVFIKVQNNSGEIVGQLSGVMTLKEHRIVKNPFLSSVINLLNLGSSFTWKQGPIIHDSDNHNVISSEIFSAIDKYCLKNKIQIIKGTTPPLDDHLFKTSISKLPYEIKNWKTYLVDLKNDSDSYLKSLNKKIRYDIRKGENNDLKFEIATSVDDFKELGMLKLRNDKSVNQIMEIANKAIESTWEHVIKKGYRKLFLVRHNGKLIGGINTLNFNKNLGQTTVINSDETYLSGGPFLTWNAIKWGMTNNYSIFDLGGVNPNPDSQKEKGIDFYKQKWNGIEHETFVLSKILDRKRTKLTHLLRDPKIISKKIWSKNKK
jgi:hypothetical protein